MKIEFDTFDLPGFARTLLFGRRRHIALFILSAMAAFLVSCLDEAGKEPPTPDRTATIFLNFGNVTPKNAAGVQASQSPGAQPAEEMPVAMREANASAVRAVQVPITRAPMTRAVDETGIQTVDVLSFKTDPADPTDIKKGTFFYRSRGVYTQITPGQGRVEVKLMGSPEAQTLVVLANARTQVDALGAVYGEQKEAVMSRLTFDVAMEVSPDLTNGIPMWGELPNEVVGEGFSPSGAPKEVTMIRSVAKFTLVNPPQSDPKGFFFYYDQLRLYNYRKKGRIAPDNYNRTDSKVNAPTVPAGARPPRGTFVQLNSEVSPGRIGIYEGKQKSFYLCEVDNTVRPSGGNALDDLCLIVYVKSHGSSFIPPKPQRHGYYRLDFKDYGTGVRMDILRNHDYRIEVESVEGLPADTPEKAFEGNHTLKCKIVPWDKVQEEVIAEGSSRMKIDKHTFVFPGDPNVTGETGGTQTLTIATENTGGWRIEGKPAWVNLSQSAGVDGMTATVTLSVVGVNPGRTDRAAVMDIVAGMLTYKLHLSQPDACGRNGTPKKMRIGNNDYYTHRFNGQCWMVENSREGTPDNILPPLPGKSTQRYLWNGYNFVEDAKNGRPAGWRVPLYTDVLHLGLTLYADATERGVWLDWQQPGVLAYCPVADPNGDVVGPWPGRDPIHFWQGNMPVWETRRLPRMASYTWQRHDDIPVFWAHQYITDVSLHAGIQSVYAADGKVGQAYMARMPVCTLLSSPPYQGTVLSPAVLVYEPDQRGRNVWVRAQELLQTYETVNRNTGMQAVASFCKPWGCNNEIVMRPFYGGSFWRAPYDDMPWRTTAGAAFFNAAVDRVFPQVNVFNNNQTNPAWGYFLTKERFDSHGHKHERDFYPGLNRLVDSSVIPRFYSSYIYTSLFNRQGLGAYLQNECPIRFVRED
ncbi:BACON domain-containing protein [Bacteroides pyogenes]|uniref:BACON domain-containing protein n=1 Tax=Bacteroides pyogenes TaxID=310300 RepID=UPI003B437D02